MPDVRGLVISSPITVSVATNMITVTGGLNQQELRSNLLFWDKLEWPDQSLFGFSIEPDIKFLMDSHILQRTRFEVHSGEFGKILHDAYINGFRKLDDAEPGVWSLSRGENSVSFDDDDLNANRGVLVQLHQAIPVPDRDVPLEDILEFREKRRAELLALRHYLEDIYERVISAGDGALALNKEIERLEGAIIDHFKASKGAGIRLRLSSLSAALNLDVGVIATVVIAGLVFNLPVVDALLVAAAGQAARMSINVGAELKRHKATPTPFQYISSFHNELF